MMMIVILSTWLLAGLIEFLGVCWLLPVKDEVEDCLFGGGGPVGPPPFEIVDIRL